MTKIHWIQPYCKYNTGYFYSSSRFQNISLSPYGFDDFGSAVNEKKLSYLILTELFSCQKTFFQAGQILLPSAMVLAWVPLYPWYCRRLVSNSRQASQCSRISLKHSSNQTMFRHPRIVQVLVLQMKTLSAHMQRLDYQPVRLLKSRLSGCSFLIAFSYLHACKPYASILCEY